MNRFLVIIVTLLLFSNCNEMEKLHTAQEIVNKSIKVSGGVLYAQSDISFNFRKIHYSSQIQKKGKILKRQIKNDTAHILDVKYPNKFERFVNDSLVILTDSMANTYANSINSVHYFAYLPYGLNDKAVNKKLLGKTKMGNEEYYKVEITFNEDGGGDDFDDIYVYWFNTQTFKPDYLAYEFHVNGGGQRFRVAFNERNIGGIRFVDYKNYKPKTINTSIHTIDEGYQKDELELLSEIKLENVVVTPGNYN